MKPNWNDKKEVNNVLQKLRADVLVDFSPAFHDNLVSSICAQVPPVDILLKGDGKKPVHRMTTRGLPHNLEGNTEVLVKELLGASIISEQVKPITYCPPVTIFETLVGAQGW